MYRTKRKGPGPGRRSSFDTIDTLVSSSGSNHFDMAAIVTAVNDIGTFIHIKHLYKHIHIYVLEYIYRYFYTY
jgi:hypothetical protein